MLGKKDFPKWRASRDYSLSENTVISHIPDVYVAKELLLNITKDLARCAMYVIYNHNLKTCSRT
jgi:hypothetical protein